MNRTEKLQKINVSSNNDFKQVHLISWVGRGKESWIQFILCNSKSGIAALFKQVLFTFLFTLGKYLCQISSPKDTFTNTTMARD